MIPFYSNSNLLLIPFIKMKNAILLVALIMWCFSAQTQCLKGDCENGKGKYKCDCGYIFEGTFENGEKKYGKMIKEDLVYTGPFKDDMAHGVGKMEHNDGSIYQGDFAFSSPHGWGTFILNNGFKYKGEINTGKYQGWGMLVDSNITPVEAEVAQFENGNLEGFSLAKMSSEGLKLGLKRKGDWNGTILIFNITEKNIAFVRYKRGKLKKKLEVIAMDTKGQFEKSFKDLEMKINFHVDYVKIDLMETGNSNVVTSIVNTVNPVVQILPENGSQYIWDLNRLDFMKKEIEN
jgi:hypothetical protein